MDKNFLECLEHIIELEKMYYTQEKLIESIEKKIKTLAISKKISSPQLIYTYVPPVNYNIVKARKIDGETIKSVTYVCSIVAGIIGAIIGNSVNAIWSGIICGVIIGALAGFFGGYIINTSREEEARIANQRAKTEAEEKAKKLTEEQRLQDKQKHQNDLKKYHALVAFDKNRVIAENNKKEELLYSKEALIKKHKETKENLAHFYNVADIYETYRNIVAICYIYEYLKSGICDQLTGRDGAYMTFKYEMYEKLKIEKLDTIASKLEQLHFDNLTLNNTMEKINSKCNNLISEISELKITQAEATKRNEELINNLGNRIDNATNRISYQNAVIAYNQECTTSELKQLKWLSVMERS